jgi:predicted AlkP superfamily pyrophosphatase or phosphodiesterase
MSDSQNADFENRDRRSLARETMRAVVFAAILGLGFGPNALAEAAANVSRHVVVVVWDGMRPDFVTAANTPALWKLAQEGAVFRNHHAVYPSSTHVNGTAIVTGMYPGHSGLTANYDYRPDIDNKKFISTEQLEVVRKGDEISGGKYIAVPTISELVRAGGGRSAIAAAKTVGPLLDRRAALDPAGHSATLFAGESLPRAALAPIVSALGPFRSQPPISHAQEDAWTTKALTDFFWKDGVPAFSLLWLGEPDLTEHETAPGAPAALAAIKSADENLSAMLSALDRKGVRASTDVFVVSDHGFSTIERAIDLGKILNDAGFSATTEFKAEPKQGEVMLVGNGGTVLFHIVGHDTSVTHRLVEFLQQSDFAGVVFTKEPVTGTFAFDQAKIGSVHEPDVEMAFRWTDSKNQFGIPGMIDGDWNRKAGKGTHATLGRFDMHNMLIAAGPDFRAGQTDDLPTGNVDLAPTILRILELKSERELDGRVLSEAMVEGEPAVPKPETETIDATREFPSGTWRQSLRISRVGSTIYLDEGNGAFVPKR